MQKNLTADQLMDEMWCRGLDYENLLHYASKMDVKPVPSIQQYEIYCDQRDREMDLFFKDCKGKTIDPEDN